MQDRLAMPLQVFSRNLALQHGVRLETYLSMGYVTVGMLVVPKDRRSEGVGSAIMEALARFADEHGRPMKLTPAHEDNLWGTTSRARLVKFYKRFGFVENKGRNKDFALGADVMYRLPREGARARAGVGEAGHAGPVMPPRRVDLGMKYHFTVVPKKEVGTLGGGRYEVWFAQSVGAMGSDYVGTMLAFDVGLQKYVGAVHLHTASFKDQEGGLDRSSACAFDLRDLSTKHGTRGDRCVVVTWSRVTDDARGKGIGAALYLASAAHARRLGMALCADACTAEGRTSEDARRVWSGKSFQAKVDTGKETNLVGVYRA